MKKKFAFQVMVLTFPSSILDPFSLIFEPSISTVFSIMLRDYPKNTRNKDYKYRDLQAKWKNAITNSNKAFPEKFGNQRPSAEVFSEAAVALAEKYSEYFKASDPKTLGKSPKNAAYTTRDIIRIENAAAAGEAKDNAESVSVFEGLLLVIGKIYSGLTEGK